MNVMIRVSIIIGLRNGSTFIWFKARKFYVINSENTIKSQIQIK